jgi:hypothetical protein
LCFDLKKIGWIRQKLFGKITIIPIKNRVKNRIFFFYLFRVWK